jgi:hypothetical protein
MRGRKKIADKKKQICIYVEGSKIDALGGKEAVKEKLLSIIDEKVLILNFYK